MGKAKLPEALREKIKSLFRQGYETKDVLRLVKTEGLLHVKTEGELTRCLTSLKGVAGPPVGKPSDMPKPKEFDMRPFQSILNGLGEKIAGKELEAICRNIAKGLLKKHEGFEKVIDGPSYRGTPFDLFGFKDGKSYAVELKSSLNSFNHPGETQKWRLNEIRKKIPELNIALLQLAVRKGQYRIFYNDQLNILFFGPKAPLEPIETWIKQRMKRERYEAF